MATPVLAALSLVIGLLAGAPASAAPPPRADVDAAPDITEEGDAEEGDAEEGDAEEGDATPDDDAAPEGPVESPATPEDPAGIKDIGDHPPGFDPSSPTERADPETLKDPSMESPSAGPRAPDGRCSVGDLSTDPLGPVDQALDELAAAGFDVSSRVREQSFRGEECRVHLQGPAHGLLQYRMDHLANDGFVVILAPTGSHALELLLRPTQGTADRGVIFQGVERVSVDGLYLPGDTSESLARIVGLDRNRLSPYLIALRLAKLGYRAEFFPVAVGEIIIQIAPARSIRRVKVHGHIPLSRREVQRKLGVNARPGSLAYGNCVQPRALRGRKPGDPLPAICSPDDLACARWVDDETTSLDRFLYDRGYLKGQASIALVCGRKNDEVELHVYLDKRRPYKIPRPELRIKGNVPDADKPWIKRTFMPRIPATPIRAPVTREFIEEAKDRTERRYAEPRDRLLRSRAAIDLRYLYPDIRVETSYGELDLDPSRVPGDPQLPLTVTIDIGRGVTTSFIPVPADLQAPGCTRRSAPGREIDPLRYSDKRLRNNLQLFKRRESPSEDKAEQEAAHLRAVYQSKGHLLAKVTGCYQEFGRSQFGELKFLIDEGPRVKVRRVDVQIPEEVTPAVQDRVRRELGLRLQLKRGGYFTEAQADKDVGEILKVFQDNGYLCASASVQAAFWREGFDEPGASATVDPESIHSVSGAPQWAERDLDPDGLRELRARDRAPLYVRIAVDPGPRVFTSARPEELRYLETQIPGSREVGDLPYMPDGSWPADRMLVEGPLRRDDDPTPGAVPLRPGLERAAEEDIIRRYREHGYPLADAKIRWIYRHPVTGVEHRVPIAKALGDTGMCAAARGQAMAEVETEISVYEGREGTFGETTLRGNFKTRDWVLRREVKYSAGEPYASDKVARSEDGMDGTGVAASVELEGQPVGCELDSSAESCVVHQIVDMREAKDISMDLSGGVGAATLDPFYVFLSPSFPNLFGTAWDLNLHGHYGFDLSEITTGALQSDCARQDCYERSARADLVRGRWLGSPLTLKIAGQAQQRATPARGNVFSVLGTLGFSWKISSRWQVYLGYLIQRANISKDVVKPTTALETTVINRRDAVVSDRTGGLQTGVTFTNIEDNPFNPDKGFIASAEALFASPVFGGLDWWLRTEFSWSHFIPIPRTANRVDFRYTLSYGHTIALPGLPLANTTSVPEVWRYFGGGTVDRGMRGIRPEEMLIDIEAIEQTGDTQRLRYTAVGGQIRALGTLALGFVSVPDLFGGKLGHSLFYDLGIMAQRWRWVQLPRDLRHSVGVNAIKWNIRLVTIALGYAILVPNAIAPGNVRPTDPRYGRVVFDVGVTF